jgi:hypothetical protein
MIYTHRVIITQSSGAEFKSDFPSQELAQAWADQILRIHGIDLVGGNHLKPRPDGSGPEYAQEVDPLPNGTCVIEDIDTREQQIMEQWSAADAFALAAVDRNERERYLGWLSDPTCSQDRKNKILAVLEWLDAIWGQYYTVKSRIISGRKGTFNPAVLPPCPYSFFDIAST